MLSHDHGINADYPALWKVAQGHDFRERLGGDRDPVSCEVDAVLRELLAARRTLLDLQWAIVELASHVHDCDELLSPRTRRITSEVRAASLARVATVQEPSSEC